MEWILPCLLGPLSHSMSWLPSPPGLAQQSTLGCWKVNTQIRAVVLSPVNGSVQHSHTSAHSQAPQDTPSCPLSSRYRMPWDTLITTNAGQPGSRNRSKLFYIGPKTRGGAEVPLSLRCFRSRDLILDTHNTSTASHVVLMVPPPFHTWERPDIMWWAWPLSC